MKHSEIFLSKKYLFIRTLKFQTLGRSLTAIPPVSWIILHHQQIKILWSVKAFSVVQEERIDSSGVENCRKRIIKSNHVENHVENQKSNFQKKASIWLLPLYTVVLRGLYGAADDKKSANDNKRWLS